MWLQHQRYERFGKLAPLRSALHCFWPREALSLPAAHSAPYIPKLSQSHLVSPALSRWSSQTTRATKRATTGTLKEQETVRC